MRNSALRLMSQLQHAQDRWLQARFVAPCLAPITRLRTRVQGLVYSFRADTRGFEGWGLFQPSDSMRAKLVGEADPEHVERYLAGCARREVRLVRPLQGRSWLAHPVHEGVGPAIVHLVDNGSPWQACRAYCDGCHLWFSELAPNGDPRLADGLQASLREQIPPRELRVPGLTPRDRAAYSMEYLHRFPPVRATEPAPTPEVGLASSLVRGGGRLRNYSDQGESWLVHWVDSLGALHTSSVRKGDLGVISAGVCLSGQDNKFDLTSLVGVVEGFE